MSQREDYTSPLKYKLGYAFQGNNSYLQWEAYKIPQMQNIALHTVNITGTYNYQ
jgi:hypothetical protein